MYTNFHLYVAIILSALCTAAAIETLHWIKDRKREKELEGK